jgi:valyl-tRNA synthetase
VAAAAPLPSPAQLALTPADRWMLSQQHRLIQRVTALLEGYDYAAAKSEVEAFFWQALSDNYLEMAKGRLYDETSAGHAAARATLHTLLLATVKLFAPFLPHVTEAIYQGLFAATDGADSLHRARWPEADATLIDDTAEACGETLVRIATAVRRYKSEHTLSLGAELARLSLSTADPALAALLRASTADLQSVTRAREVTVADHLEPGQELLAGDGRVAVAITG